MCAEMKTSLMSNSWGDILRKMIYFSGMIVIALLVMVIIHEFGHAFALYQVTGQVAEIQFHPFKGAVTKYSGQAGSLAGRLYVTAAGMLYGIAAGITMIAIAWRCRKTICAFIAMAGLMSMAANAMALVLGSYFFMGGDVSKLIALGVPKPLLALIGVVVSLAVCWLFIRLLPRFGFDPKEPFFVRFWVMGAPIWIYSAAVLMANAFSRPELMSMYFFYCGAGSLMMLLLSAGSIWIHRNSTIGQQEPVAVITWPQAVFSVLIALSALIYCWVWLE